MGLFSKKPTNGEKEMFDLLCYNTEQSLIGLEYLVNLKYRPKGELNRQLAIAQMNVTLLCEYRDKLNLGISTRYSRLMQVLIDDAKVSKWAAKKDVLNGGTKVSATVK